MGGTASKTGMLINPPKLISVWSVRSCHILSQVSFFRKYNEEQAKGKKPTRKEVGFFELNRD
jgi:hypothetical protein